MKKSLAVMLSMVMVFVLTACGGKENNPVSSDAPAAPPAETKVITGSFGWVDSPEAPAAIGAKYFIEQLSEKTGGAIELTFYPNGQLGGDRDMIESMQMGGLDFSLVGTTVFSAFEPVLSLFDFPFLYKDAQAAHDILDSDIAAEIYSVTANENVHFLGAFETGFRQLETNKPVNSLADIEGMIIRIPQGAIFQDTWAALGVNATPTAWTELFSALQTGVIDGAEAPLSPFVAAGFGEVCKNIAYINYSYDPLMLCVSDSFWQKLTPEQQEIVREVAKDACNYQRQYNADYETNLEESLTEEWGVSFTHPDQAEWRDAVQSIYDNFQYQDELARVLDYMNK